MEYNLFNTQYNDFEELKDKYGVDVRINNLYNTVGVVTNPIIADFDFRYVSTSTPLKRGDYLVFEGRDWFVVNEIELKRGESYKAVVRQCEHRVNFNVSPVGYAYYDIRKLPCIVTKTRDIGVIYTSGSGIDMYLPDGQLSVILQDDVNTRLVYKAWANASGLHNIIFGGRAWKIDGIDITKSGFFNLNISATTFGANDDKINEVCWLQTPGTVPADAYTEPYLPPVGAPSEPIPVPDGSDNPPVVDSGFIVEAIVNYINPTNPAVGDDGNITFKYPKYLNATAYRITLRYNMVINFYSYNSPGRIGGTNAGTAIEGLVQDKKWYQPSQVYQDTTPDGVNNPKLISNPKLVIRGASDKDLINDATDIYNPTFDRSRVPAEPNQTYTMEGTVIGNGTYTVRFLDAQGLYLGGSGVTWITRTNSNGQPYQEGRVRTGISTLDPNTDYGYPADYEVYYTEKDAAGVLKAPTYAAAFYVLEGELINPTEFTTPANTAFMEIYVRNDYGLSSVVTYKNFTLKQKNHFYVTANGDELQHTFVCPMYDIEYAGTVEPFVDGAYLAPRISVTKQILGTFGYSGNK